MENEKHTSKIGMSITSSTGTLLNGCLQPQHYFASIEVTDPEGKVVVKIALSYEQVARMLMSNGGQIDCTLLRYRGCDGNLITENVLPPETIHNRMKDRLGETQSSLLKRVEDIRRDLYEMVNGDAKRNKGKIDDLLHEVEVVKNHMIANQNFVVQKAEEELEEMKNNAIGQIGIFLQSKFGLETDKKTLEQLLPTSKEPILIGDSKPVDDHYELKQRAQKTIESMTAMQVADVMGTTLRRLESEQKNDKQKHKLFCSSATESHGNTVTIRYISYQSRWIIDLETAKKYLKFLLSIKTVEEFKTHFSLGI